jgi:hypothetical protein
VDNSQVRLLSSILITITVILDILTLWQSLCWIYNYLCNQCLSPLTLWSPIPLRHGLLDTALCDKVCQWLMTGLWGTPVSSTNDITDILLKVALNTITLTLHFGNYCCWCCPPLKYLCILGWGFSLFGHWYLYPWSGVWQ